MRVYRPDLVHRRIPFLVAASGLTFVAAVLAGWLFGSEVLVRGAPGRAAMVPSTAISLGLLFCGLLLHLRRDSPRGAVQFCAGLAAAVALTNSVFIRLDAAGLDALVASRAPGDSMATGTIAGVLTGALGLVALGSTRLVRLEVPVLAALAGLSGIISVLFVHNFHVGAPLALSFAEAMSIYTALCLLGLFSALLLVALAPGTSLYPPDGRAPN
ncbi:hypothetical protein PVT71_00940 [Salipiger sp. H15]|uniref:DUF1109 domain-containing protein n=1 Tax=Alloyangia sp. H15 TaxID=3029062 RepID=A0AAU8AH06_9RHOB